MPARFRTALLAALLSLLTLHANPLRSQPAKMEVQPLEIRKGDVITQQNADGSWATIKILQIDKYPDGTSAAHCLLYEPTPARPTAAEVSSMKVRIWHAPLRADGFRTGWQRITHAPVSRPELVGLEEYLKHTDFRAYLQLTGQSLETIVARATEHYKRAYAHGERGQRTEALEEYSKAIDLVPRFYEAIDNRAFTYMELGRFEEALADFEQSLRINPDGFKAFFSRGECMLRLGRRKEAEAVFAQGMQRFPQERALFNKYREIAASGRGLN